VGIDGKSRRGGTFVDVIVVSGSASVGFAIKKKAKKELIAIPAK